MGFHEKIYHGISLTSGIKNRGVNNPEGYICAVIIVQAIKDWRKLISTRAWLSETLQRPDKNFGEIRAFFRSEYCALLMQSFELKPKTILQQLEKELDEAKDKWLKEGV